MSLPFEAIDECIEACTINEPEEPQSDAFLGLSNPSQRLQKN